jgi:hypothetical protein
MYRRIFAAGALSVLSLVMLANAPALAITAKQKLATCQFGADHPNGGSGPALVGKDRKRFMDKCMSNKNDPRGPAVGTPGGPSAPNG